MQTEVEIRGGKDHDSGMEYLHRARRVIEIELAEMRSMAERLDESFVQAITIIKSALEARSKVVVVGVGKSGHIGEKIAATLTSTGSTAVVLNAQNALHGDLGVVSDGDVILGLSYSGETEDLVRILPALGRFDVKMIAITGHLKSTLAQASDCVLDVHVSKEACPLNLAPTSSTTTMLALGDALAMVLLEARGFDKDDFARFHPGGRLGQTLLLKVRNVMRGEERLALVSREAPIIDVLKKITERRSGTAVVVDEKGLLEGVFTNGDFVRHFPTTPDIGSRPVGEFMSRHPISILADKLVAEMLHVLQHHRIDDLVVVDESGRPVGTVDSQDLSRLKIG